jgi:hypothetical protein
MKYYIPLLLLMLTSCSDKEVVKQTYPSGNKKVTYVVLEGPEEDPITFEYRSYFEHGGLEKEGIVRNKKEDGEWKYYSNEGNLVSVGTFRNGTQHGKFQTFYDNGKVQRSGIYTRGEVSKVTNYNRDGVVTSRTSNALLLIKDSATPWTEEQRTKVGSECYSALKEDYSEPEKFCKCILDSVSKYVEYHAIDSLPNSDKSMIYRNFTVTGSCMGFL